MAHDLRLASLLVSRVCHDLVSPVGAVINGLEVLADEKDPGMREEALRLIEQSAEQASAKLKFARLAFGASGSRGETLPLGEIREACENLFSGERVSLTWKAGEEEAPKAVARALAGLAALGAECLPRGGTVVVSLGNEGAERVAVATCSGTGARVASEVLYALTEEPDLSDLDGRGVLALIVKTIAEEGRGHLATSTGTDEVALRAHFPA